MFLTCVRPFSVKLTCRPYMLGSEGWGGQAGNAMPKLFCYSTPFYYLIFALHTITDIYLNI